MRANIVVILYVIFMVGRRNEQRVKINHVNTQILQVIHLIQHSLQIPTVKLPHPHGSRVLVPVLHFYGIITDITVFIGQYIIWRIPVIKTVHVNLVHDRPFRPFRRLITRNQPEIIMPVRLLLYPLQAVIT